jgi:hypothetical protein
MHDSNTIIKFTNDTTVVGLITNNDETVYREEVRDLEVWCQDNNHSLNVSKTMELIVDYRKRRAEHPPIQIDGVVVEHIKVPWCPHYKHTIMVQTHQDSREEGTTKPIAPQETPQETQILRSSKSYAAAPSRAWLHPCLAWQLLGIQTARHYRG